MQTSKFNYNTTMFEREKFEVDYFCVDLPLTHIYINVTATDIT